jgi:hypothetical protein
MLLLPKPPHPKPPHPKPPHPKPLPAMLLRQSHPRRRHQQLVIVEGLVKDLLAPWSSYKRRGQVTDGRVNWQPEKFHILTEGGSLRSLVKVMVFSSAWRGEDSE